MPTPYIDDAVGQGMALFDELPRPVRDQLNYGVVSQKGKDMPPVHRLWRQRGEAHVLNVLQTVSARRMAGEI